MGTTKIGAFGLLAATAIAATAPGAAAAGQGAPGASPEGGKSHCRPSATLADLPPRRGPDWYGLYVGGKKVGWLEARSAAETRDGRPVRVYRQDMLVEVIVGTRQVQRRASEERVYEAGKGGRLLSMTTTFGGDGGDRAVRVSCGARTCTARITAADGSRTTEIPHPGETAEEAEASRLAALTCRAVTGPQLQAEDLRIKRMTDRWTGRTSIGAGGVEVPVSIVEQAEEGDRVASRVLVADDGRIVETRVGDGMVIRVEPEELARRLDVVDLFTMLRVPLPAPLPRDVPMVITYGLRGLPKGFDLRDERQAVSAGPGGETILTVTARPPAGPDVPRGKPAERGDPDQAATIDVDWDHPAIRKLAAATVAGTPGTWAAARKIGQEVHRRLEKVYGQSRDRASEILEQGKGDCTEHTRLFVALARASGIRAREVKGLVYANYGQGGPGLYWHAWPEVKVGDTWVAMDPTFGQDVADATHVALGRGSRQDAIALVGALQVTRADPHRP
jgi:transglutaminase-like putative cysteine protease